MIQRAAKGSRKVKVQPPATTQTVIYRSKRHPSTKRNIPTIFLGKVERMAIFAFEEFSHEFGRKPLSLAQIRRLEPCS